MEGKQIRVGIVGAGGVADYGHLPGIRDAGGVVAAVADLDPAKARAMADRHQIGRWYDSHHKLLGDGSIDVVAVCTQSSAHAGIAIDALRAGKHVFIEKPPTESAAQMASVAAVAREAGRYVIAGSHHPCRENVSRLREMIAAGELGEIYAVECRKLRSQTFPDDDETVTLPGGTGRDSSVHRLDVALFLLGVPAIRSVVARTNNHFVMDKARREGRKASGLIDDTVFAFVEFVDGCTFTLRDVGDSHFPLPTTEHWLFGEFRVYGTRAAADLHPLRVYRKRPDGQVDVTMPGVDHFLHAGHAPTYRHLFDCIRTGREPEGTLDRAVALMTLLDAIYDSAGRGGEQIRF
jgi:predicted dehydrogenase